MSRMLSTFLNGLWAMVLILVFFWLGPEFETKLFPVYSKFKAIDIKPLPDGVQATFQYIKWRNCEPQGYAWYSGDFATGYKQLNTHRPNTGFNVPRPIGPNISAPVILQGITIEDLTSNVFAELYSRCHPLWITRTVIYP